MAGIWLAGVGGPQAQVSRGLGLRDGAVATYNRNAATAEVYADIKGVWADDRTDASGSYLILENEGSEFIVTDGQGVYRTGQNIIAEKLTTKVGDAIQRTTQTLMLNDEDVVVQLQALRMANPSARIYVSGSIIVDFPEDVRPTLLPRQLPAVTVVGESVELAYCELEVAIAALDDQWVMGVVTALFFE